MLLLRDDIKRADMTRLMASHLRDIQAAQTGSGNLQELQVQKLIKMLDIAACSELFADSLGMWRTGDVLAMLATKLPGEVLAAVLPQLPILDRSELRERSRAAFTRPSTDFLHYYESSGTTGDPVAAPKAVDDLIVNTMNIGEMWGRFLCRDDSALILINGPFAPAGYQFEKVLEYVGVMSVRLWTDNVTGDYTRVLRIAQELGMNTYVGTASRLLEVLQFAIHSSVPFPRFSRLLLMAEQTGEHLTRHLENLTGATAYICSFGSSETGTTAVTCECRRLHLQVQSYLIEVCDAAGARLVNGEPDCGELMVTTLDLPARPLVRYRTGDLVEVTGEQCPCGLALPVVRPLGRQQDVMALDGVHLRQEEFESLLWPADRTEQSVLNYMLVLRGPCIVCLITTDRPVGSLWCSTTTERLARAFPGKRFALRVVDSLPPLANMGAYVGWKLSRVLDLDDDRMWDKLPAPIHAVLLRTLEQIDSITNGSRLGSDPVMKGTGPYMTSERNPMTDADKAQFVLGVYFRTQAAIERYLGPSELPRWTQHVAQISAETMRKRLPSRADQARDLLTGLESMLEVYGSATTRTDEPQYTRLDVQRCGIYDYRERAQQQGVQLTLKRPCEYCVDLHYRTAAELGVTVENELGERSCRWIAHIPADAVVDKPDHNAEG